MSRHKQRSKQLVVLITLIIIAIIIFYFAKPVQKPYVPSESPLVQAVCAKYSNLPADIVPCLEAYDFIYENYGNVAAVDLISETADGERRFFTRSSLSERANFGAGSSLRWYAELKAGATYKKVILDARTLAVIEQS